VIGAVASPAAAGASPPTHEYGCATGEVEIAPAVANGSPLSDSCLTSGNEIGWTYMCNISFGTGSTWSWPSGSGPHTWIRCHYHNRLGYAPGFIGLNIRSNNATNSARRFTRIQIPICSETQCKATGSAPWETETFSVPQSLCDKTETNVWQPGNPNTTPNPVAWIESFELECNFASAYNGHNDPNCGTASGQNSGWGITSATYPSYWPTPPSTCTSYNPTSIMEHRSEGSGLGHPAYVQYAIGTSFRGTGLGIPGQGTCGATAPIELGCGPLAPAQLLFDYVSFNSVAKPPWPIHLPEGGFMPTSGDGTSPEPGPGECEFTNIRIVDNTTGANVFNAAPDASAWTQLGDYFWRNDRSYLFEVKAQPIGGEAMASAIEIYLLYNPSVDSIMVRLDIGTYPAGGTGVKTFTLPTVQFEDEGSAVVLIQSTSDDGGGGGCGTLIGDYDPEVYWEEQYGSSTMGSFKECFDAFKDDTDDGGSGWADDLKNFVGSVAEVLTPVNWMQAAACVTKWAFVPSGSTRPYLRALKSDIEVSPLGIGVSMLSLPGDVIAAASSTGSCSGPSINYPGAGTMHLLSTCGETDQLADIVRAFTTVVFYVFGGFIVLRVAAGAMGLRLPVGGGGDE
jgi:hypothetical protein